MKMTGIIRLRLKKVLGEKDISMGICQLVMARSEKLLLRPYAIIRLETGR